MCKAMEEMRNEAEARGMANGIIKSGRLMNLTDEQIIANLVAVCNITKENAMKILGVQPA